MTKHVYGAVIRETENGAWWGEVPDLPGCYGEGDTFMEAVASVADSLETHIASLIDYGLPLPASSPIRSEEGEVVYVYANTDSLSLGEPSVSAAEAARMLGITPGRISQLISEGKLTALRTAGSTSVTLSSIEDYRRNRRKPGRPRHIAQEA